MTAATHFVKLGGPGDGGQGPWDGGWLGEGLPAVMQVSKSVME